MSVAEAVRVMVRCTHCAEGRLHEIRLVDCTRGTLESIYRLNREQPDMGDPEPETLIPRIQAREHSDDPVLMRRMENVDRRRWNLRATDTTAWLCAECNRMNLIAPPKPREDYIHWTHRPRPAVDSLWSRSRLAYGWMCLMMATPAEFIALAAVLLAFLAGFVCDYGLTMTHERTSMVRLIVSAESLLVLGGALVVMYLTWDNTRRRARLPAGRPAVVARSAVEDVFMAQTGRRVYIPSLLGQAMDAIPIVTSVVIAGSLAVLATCAFVYVMAMH